MCSDEHDVILDVILVVNSRSARAVLADVMIRPLKDRKAISRAPTMGKAPLPSSRVLAGASKFARREAGALPPVADAVRVVSALQEACGLAADKVRGHALLRAAPAGCGPGRRPLAGLWLSLPFCTLAYRMLVGICFF